jgi:hypothetical protein
MTEEGRLQGAVRSTVPRCSSNVRFQSSVHHMGKLLSCWRARLPYISSALSVLAAQGEGRLLLPLLLPVVQQQNQQQHYCTTDSMRRLCRCSGMLALAGSTAIQGCLLLLYSQSYQLGVVMISCSSWWRSCKEASFTPLLCSCLY